MNQTYESEIIEKDQASYLPVFSRCLIVLDHGEGAYVCDVKGRRYLDALGGIAVNVLGHNDPALVGAVAAQAGRLIHVSNLYYTAAQAEAADRLSRLTNGGKVFFGNSGERRRHQGGAEIRAHDFCGQGADRHGTLQFPRAHTRDADGDGTGKVS